MVPGTSPDPARPAAVRFRPMQPALAQDVTPVRLTAEEQLVLARRRLGLRLLAALLAGLWTGLALVVLLAYRPGGPLDLLVALTVGLPAAIAALAIVWPPVARSWRRTAAIAWLGVCAAMLVGPLVGLVVTQLVSGGGRTLLPSPRWPTRRCWRRARPACTRRWASSPRSTAGTIRRARARRSAADRACSPRSRWRWS